jgi:glycogen operon protein
VLGGAAGEFFTRGGQRDIDESFLVMMNAYYGNLDFRFPRLATPLLWEALVDTAEPTGLAKDSRLWQPGEVYRLRAHSFALFINRAPEAAPIMRLAESITEPDCTGPKAGDDAPSP